MQNKVLRGGDCEQRADDGQLHLLPVALAALAHQRHHLPACSGSMPLKPRSSVLITWVLSGLTAACPVPLRIGGVAWRRVKQFHLRHHAAIVQSPGGGALCLQVGVRHLCARMAVSGDVVRDACVHAGEHEISTWSPQAKRYQLVQASQGRLCDAGHIHAAGQLQWLQHLQQQWSVCMS